MLSPPAHGHPDDDGGEERPPLVLIEPYAYFADRDNATTATCQLTGFNGTFKLTFCTARPPLVSYTCFHATAYHHTDFPVDPQILATETDGGLVLLHVVFANHLSPIKVPRYGEHLVYDAAGPSHQRLPCTADVVFSDCSVAFVRPDGASPHDYVLAAHSGVLEYEEEEPFELLLYHSDTGTWRTRPLVLKQPPSSHPEEHHSTSKAITIGGDKGTVAWIDLSHSILLCDVLAQRPELRSLELPPPVMYGGDPSYVRDISVLDDGKLFKYVEMQFHVAQPGSRASLDHYWEATVWSTKTSSSSAEDWHVDHRLKSSDIPGSSLPELRVDLGRAQPTLSSLHTGMPNLSLQDDGIVYFLSKVYHCNNEHVAWVLAVDMRSKIIQKVGEFSPTRTLGLSRGYNATGISKYLKGTKQNHC